MYEPQRLVDMQDNPSLGDPDTWLSSCEADGVAAAGGGSDHLRTRSQGGNLDPVLFHDLVEMVPLVQSLIDQKARSSFTRRGSVTYTKTPSRESLSKKTLDQKGKNASMRSKKKRDPGEKEYSKASGNNQDADNFSIFSSRSSCTDRDAEELAVLREQVEELQKKLLEKDELLKSAENLKYEINEVQSKLDELKKKSSEKDSLIKSTQQQLNDAKIKLADKQAAVEKLQWEAMTSNKKAERLQEELDCVQAGISSFRLLVEGLTKNDSTAYAEDYDIKPYFLDDTSDNDDLDDINLQEMEEAREAYIAAVAAAKEKQDEESIADAAGARLYLQSFVFKSRGALTGNVLSNGRFS